MALVFPQSSDGQVVIMPPGLHVGHIHLTQHDPVFRGSGPGKTIIRADGTFGSLIQGNVMDGGIRSATIENCTLDLAGLPGIVALDANTALKHLTARNVHVVGHHRSVSAADNAAEMDLTDVVINGDGGNINHRAVAKRITVNRCRIRGGRFGFQNEGGAGKASQRGIVLASLRSELHFWACPTYEAVTVTGFGERFADVESHREDHRNLYDVLRALTPVGWFGADKAPVCKSARKWDRVEVADGHWSQVLAVAPGGLLVLDDWHAPGSWRIVPNPGGKATVYRVSLGNCLGSAPTRIPIATPSGAEFGHWRGVEGDVCNPVMRPGTRLDILRHAYAGAAAEAGLRDVDTGGIHITDTAIDSIVADCHTVGSFSDCHTGRAPGGLWVGSDTDLGGDMAGTFQDGQRVVRSKFSRAGVSGITVTGGPSEFVECESFGNGLRADGGGGVGVVTDPDALDSVLGVKCWDNHGGSFAGARTAGDM